MKVQVYHYDDSDAILARTLGTRPEEGSIRAAWEKGAYSFAYEFDTNDDDRDILDIVCGSSQVSGVARATNVGDVLVFNNRAHAVMPVGFMVVDIPL